MTGPAAPAVDVKAPARRFDLWDLVAGLLLTALALWARTPGLWAPTLWLDDAWQALVHRADTWPELVQVSATAPGFAVALKGWFVAAGFSEVVAQSLPLVLGVAWVPSMYLILRWAGASRPAALLVGALAASSPVHATYSTRVKQFTTDAVVSTGILVVAWAAIRTEHLERRRAWPVAAVAGLAVVVSGSVAPVAGGAVLAVAREAWRGGDRRTAVALPLAFGGFGLLWYLFFLRGQVTGGLSRYWEDYYLDPSSPASSFWTAVTRFADGLVPSPAWLWGVVVGLAVIVALVRRSEVRWLLALPALAAIGLALLGLAPLGGGRTDIYLYPVVLYGAGLGLHEVTGWLGRWSWGVAGVGLAGLLLVQPAGMPYPIEDVAPLVEIVDESASPGEAVAVYQLTRYPYALYTDQTIDIVDCPNCGTGFDVRFGREDVVIVPGRRPAEIYPERLGALAEDYETVWFIASHLADDIPDIEAGFASAGYEEVTRWVREDALLIRYRLGSG